MEQRRLLDVEGDGLGVRRKGGRENEETLFVKFQFVAVEQVGQGVQGRRQPSGILLFDLDYRRFGLIKEEEELEVGTTHCVDVVRGRFVDGDDVVSSRNVSLGVNVPSVLVTSVFSETEISSGELQHEIADDEIVSDFDVDVEVEGDGNVVGLKRTLEIVLLVVSIKIGLERKVNLLDSGRQRRPQVLGLVDVGTAEWTDGQVKHRGDGELHVKDEAPRSIVLPVPEQELNGIVTRFQSNNEAFFAKSVDTSDQRSAAILDDAISFSVVKLNVDIHLVFFDVDAEQRALFDFEGDLGLDQDLLGGGGRYEPLIALDLDRSIVSHVAQAVEGLRDIENGDVFAGCELSPLTNVAEDEREGERIASYERNARGDLLCEFEFVNIGLQLGGKTVVVETDGVTAKVNSSGRRNQLGTNVARQEIGTDVDVQESVFGNIESPFINEFSEFGESVEDLFGRLSRFKSGEGVVHGRTSVSSVLGDLRNDRDMARRTSEVSQAVLHVRLRLNHEFEIERRAENEFVQEFVGEDNLVLASSFKFRNVQFTSIVRSDLVPFTLSVQLLKLEVERNLRSSVDTKSNGVQGVEDERVRPVFDQKVIDHVDHVRAVSEGTRVEVGGKLGKRTREDVFFLHSPAGGQGHGEGSARSDGLVLSGGKVEHEFVSAFLDEVLEVVCVKSVVTESDDLVSDLSGLSVDNLDVGSLQTNSKIAGQELVAKLELEDKGRSTIASWNEKVEGPEITRLSIFVVTSSDGEDFFGVPSVGTQRNGRKNNVWQVLEGGEKTR